MTDLMASARRALHLDVTCPACRAGFSQPCRTPSGAPRAQVHKVREHAPRITRWVQPDLFTAAEGAHD
jgi:hypothetical protein